MTTIPEVWPPSPLTKREVQLLTLISEGLTNEEVGKQLWISPNTVKSHLARISRKIGTRADRTQIVALALRSRWMQ